MGVELTLAERVAIFDTFVDYVRLKGETHQDTFDVAVGLAARLRELDYDEVIPWITLQPT